MKGPDGFLVVLPEQVMHIVERVAELAERYGCKMSQIALAWQWAKGVASPIVGATKEAYLTDAANALNVKLTDEDVAYLEEMYVAHPVVGAIKQNPPQGVMLLDEKKVNMEFLETYVKRLPK